MSGREWTPLSSAAFAPIIGSGNTHELLRADWPTWAQSAQQVKRLWIYGMVPGEMTSSPRRGHSGCESLGS